MQLWKAAGQQVMPLQDATTQGRYCAPAGWRDSAGDMGVTGTTSTPGGGPQRCMLACIEHLRHVASTQGTLSGFLTRSVDCKRRVMCRASHPRQRSAAWGRCWLLPSSVVGACFMPQCPSFLRLQGGALRPTWAIPWQMPRRWFANVSRDTESEVPAGTSG